MFCYTNETDQYIQPKAPGGGGFGTEVITLQYCYQQYKARNCIWTVSNQYTDLCRYTGCKITLYRHPTIDFIFQYNLQPPFTIEKFTYQDLQPQTMLLHPHHKVILSKSSKPNGRLRHTYKIKPPKELSTKWFFQRDFSHIPLVQLSASAADLQYSTYGLSNASQMLTIYALNSTHFYKQSTWAQFTRGPYKPYETLTTPITFRYIDSKGQQQVKVVGEYPGSPTEQYRQSVSRLKGWFQNVVLFSAGMKPGKFTNLTDYNESHTQELGTHPIVIARYNPLEDDGGGNEVWLTSILTGAYDKPQVTPNYLIQG